MVLDASLLNIQHYKVRIKGKVEQSRKWSCALSDTLVVAIEKGAFGSTSTKVAHFTLLIGHIITSIYVICGWRNQNKTLQKQ